MKLLDDEDGERERRESVFGKNLSKGNMGIDRESSSSPFVNSCKKVEVDEGQKAAVDDHAWSLYLSQINLIGITS